MLYLFVILLAAIIVIAIVLLLIGLAVYGYKKHQEQKEGAGRNLID